MFGTVINCTTYEMYRANFESTLPQLIAAGRDPGVLLTPEQWRRQPGVYECGAPSGPVSQDQVIATSLATAGGGMQAVPVKTTPPLPPGEVSSVNHPNVLYDRVSAPMMMAAPGRLSPLVWVAVAAGALYLFSRRGRRA